MSTGSTEQGASPPSIAARLAPVGVLALAFAYFLVGQWQLQKKLLDDGFIELRMARNMAAGLGAVWNPGGEPTEAWTSFLHPVTLAAVVRCGLEPVRANLTLQAVSALGLIAIAGWVLLPRLGKLGTAGAALLGTYLTDEAGILRGATNGLEGVFFCFVTVLTWFAALRFLERPGRARAALVALGCFATALGRPTGTVFGGVVLALLFAHFAFGRERSRPARNAALLAAGLVALAGAAFVAFKLTYFGHLLPNPYYLKGTQVPELAIPTALDHYGRILLWLSPVLVLAVVFGARRWPGLLAEPSVRTRVLLTVLPPLVFLLYFGFFADIPRGQVRLFVPVHAFLIIGAAALLIPLKSAGPALRHTLTALSLAVLAYFGAWNYLEGKLDFPPRVHGPSSMVRLMEQIGRGLGESGLGPRATLVADSAGAVSYFSDFRQIDRGGLANNFLAGRHDPTPEEREAYVWAQAPDVYIGFEPPASPGAEKKEDEPLMEKGYVLDSLIRRRRTRVVDVRLFGANADIVHSRMRELRDGWHLVGLAVDSLYWERAWGLWLFAYVRRDSPHFDLLVETVRKVVDRTPDEIDLVDWRTPRPAKDATPGD